MPDPPRRGRLADGREILYFDDAASPDRGAPPADPRPPEARPVPAEQRHDPLSNEWVVVAPHRQSRTHLPATAECPLCPSSGDAATEIPAPAYDVAVFENRFPSLPAVGPDGAVRGRCEVVVFSSEHAAEFSGLGDERLRTIGAAWAQRASELGAEPGIEHVFVFENRGEEIGVTLHHPHGQIYAYPFVPPRAGRLAAVAERHHAIHGRCLGCDILAEEIDGGRRVIHASDHTVAYVPRAARWPYEIHVVPRRHVPDLAVVAPDERDDLVRAEADVLARLDRLFGRPVPYMAGWMAAPRSADPTAQHLRLEVVSPQREAGKLKYTAGSETLAGSLVTDVVPEVAADRLRDAGGR